jgi:hypothetical protein
LNTISLLERPWRQTELRHPREGEERPFPKR